MMQAEGLRHEVMIRIWSIQLDFQQRLTADKVKRPATSVDVMY